MWKAGSGPDGIFDWRVAEGTRGNFVKRPVLSDRKECRRGGLLRFLPPQRAKRDRSFRFVPRENVTDLF